MSRLLIVDENDAFRKDARAHLQDSYEIIDTGNPEQALQMAVTGNPDIILLDLQMPEFSGLELCQTLHSLSSTNKIPILVLSSDPASSYRILSRNLGAIYYLEKPVDFDNLNARVAALLNARGGESRFEVRVRLKATLKLRGKDKNGKPFEITTTTENVSANGFICCCNAELRKDSMVEVLLVAEGECNPGTARAVRAEWRDSQKPHYGFRFVTKPRRWFLI